MRICPCALIAVAVAALTVPLSVTAQFQSPTAEELKMTAEPSVPGANAIYLYLEETVDDNLHTHGFYCRIKVLTEKGKELATVSVPYPKGEFSVDDIRGRTIHSDGTIIPLDVKPADLVEHKGNGFQINKRVFTLPSAEVGSILEYRWQIRYGDLRLSSPDWIVQQPYFVRKAHYLFNPYKFLERVVDSHDESANELLYSQILPPGVKVIYEEGVKRYTLNVTDMPPVPDEEYMPPNGAFAAQVHFYYSQYNSKDEFWKHEGARWSKEMDRFAVESKTLKEVATGIVAPGDSEDVKAHKIYDAVMKLDNTDYSRRKSAGELKQLGLKQTKVAEDVWRQKSGSSDEIALLYLSLARIVGLKAYALTVSNRDRRIMNPYFLSMYQFDDVLVIVSIDGKEMVIDPGKRFCPFGQLDWRHNYVGGLRQMEKGTLLIQTPNNSYKEAATVRVADLTVDRTGSVTGVIRITMSGPVALRWRQSSIDNDADEIKKQFNEDLGWRIPDGLHAELDHFIGLDDYHSALMAVVNVSGNMGTATGKRVFMPGVFFESRAKHPFVAQEKRVTPVDMGYADTVRDQVTYHLPDSFAVVHAPADASVPWPNHASFIMKSVVTKNDLTVARSLSKNFTMLGPDEYKDLREYYQKIATADQQQLVLTVTPTSAGN